MNTSRYEQVAQLISQIRNAKFGQMVNYLEELISTGIWQDFTTPEGTHFQFRRCEFDYFLASQEIDPEMVKRSYIHAADVDGLAGKRLHLADITGQGTPPVNGDRRDRKDVAKEYGDRVLRYEPVVTDTVARVARNPELRKQLAATGQAPVLRRRWNVDIHKNDTTVAQAIADKLIADPGLAHEVWKILQAHEMRITRAEHNRRSGSENGSKGDPHSVT